MPGPLDARDSTSLGPQESFETPVDALDGMTAAVKALSDGVGEVDQWRKEQNAAAERTVEEKDTRPQEVADRISRAQRRAFDALVQWEAGGRSFLAAAVAFTKKKTAPRQPSDVEELLKAAEVFHDCQMDCTKHLQMMGDALVGRGYMYMLQHSQLAAEVRKLLCVNAKVARAFGSGLVIAVIGFWLAIDLPFEGGAGVVAFLAAAGAVAGLGIWGLSSLVAGAFFLAGHHQHTHGKKTVRDDLKARRKSDERLYSATIKTLQAVLTTSAAVQRFQQLARDVIAACKENSNDLEAQYNAVAKMLTYVRPDGIVDVHNTVMPGTTMTLLIALKTQLLSYQPLDDGEVPFDVFYTACFHKICKLPAAGVSKGTWGLGHVSVLCRVGPGASLKVSVKDLLGNTMKDPEYLGQDGLFVTGCHRVHVSLTIVDESVKPSKVNTWTVFGASDWVVYRRADGTLHLADRAELSKLL